MRAGTYLRPDWTMLGVQAGPGEFHVYASSDLTQAELRAEQRIINERPWDFSRFIESETRVFLTVEMRSFVLAVGDTYADALRKIMQTWDPTAPPPAPIGPATPALAPGQP